MTKTNYPTQNKFCKLKNIEEYALEKTETLLSAILIAEANWVQNLGSEMGEITGVKGVEVFSE